MLPYKDDGIETDHDGGSVKRTLQYILDIPLEFYAELGRTKLLIAELTQLGQGSVIEFDRMSQQPIEIFVSGKLIALGESVVINEKYGVRLIEIISPEDRIKQLG